MSLRQIVRGSEVNMNVGEIIQRCRWQRDLSQRELSELSGIPRQTIGGVELNKHSTSVAIFTTLLEAMGYRLFIVDERARGGKE